MKASAIPRRRKRARKYCPPHLLPTRSVLQKQASTKQSRISRFVSIRLFVQLASNNIPRRIQRQLVIYMRLFERGLKVRSPLHLVILPSNRSLDALSTLPVADAEYMSVTKEQCYETTRTGIHHSIMSSLDARTSRFVWLQGSPGTGKTAIAKRIADDLAKNKRLAASFFWDKTGSRANTDSIEFFPSTLASQLATFNQDYETLLVNCLLDRSSRNVLRLPLEMQMDTLVIQPMSSISQAFSLAECASVVVLDGLDECGSRDVLVKLMDLVLLLDKLPREFMILVSARPNQKSALFWNVSITFLVCIRIRSARMIQIIPSNRWWSGD